MEEKEVIVKHKDKVKYSFTVSREVYEEFRSLCKKMGMKMSPRIELMMEADINSIKKMLPDLEIKEDDKLGI